MSAEALALEHREFEVALGFLESAAIEGAGWETWVTTDREDLGFPSCPQHHRSGGKKPVERVRKRKDDSAGTGSHGWPSNTISQ